MSCSVMFACPIMVRSFCEFVSQSRTSSLPCLIIVCDLYAEKHEGSFCSFHTTGLSSHSSEETVNSLLEVSLSRWSA